MLCALSSFWGVQKKMKGIGSAPTGKKNYFEMQKSALALDTHIRTAAQHTDRLKLVPAPTKERTWSTQIICYICHCSSPSVTSRFHQIISAPTHSSNPVLQEARNLSLQMVFRVITCHTRRLQTRTSPICSAARIHYHNSYWRWITLQPPRGVTYATNCLWILIQDMKDNKSLARTKECKTEKNHVLPSLAEKSFLNKEECLFIIFSQAPWETKLKESSEVKTLKTSRLEMALEEHRERLMSAHNRICL